jgi:hypothetical protein
MLNLPRLADAKELLELGLGRRLPIPELLPSDALAVAAGTAFSYEPLSGAGGVRPTTGRSGLLRLTPNSASAARVSIEYAVERPCGAPRVFVEREIGDGERSVHVRLAYATVGRSVIPNGKDEDLLQALANFKTQTTAVLITLEWDRIAAPSRKEQTADLIGWIERVIAGDSDPNAQRSSAE